MTSRNAPAKINLGLHVLRRRPDGFHDIETVFIRIPWSDVLSVEPSSDLTLSCSDPSLPTDERNLVMKAALLLRRTYGASTGAHFHLEKRIPYGAGLGGGSSDAAAALRLLNDHWSLALGDDRLARHGLELGSDVPFFLGAEAALGSGRGEKLEPLIDPQTDEPFRPAYPLVVVVPEIAVSTAEAYGAIMPRDTGRPNLKEVVLSRDLERWRRELINDFERPVLRNHPEIAELKKALESAGAGYAAMSGTGSAVYGFFTDTAAAAAAEEALRLSGHGTWMTG